MWLWDIVRLTIPALRALIRSGDGSSLTLAHQFQQNAHSGRAERVFLLFGEQRITYREANALTNRHAHAYRGLGIAQGDVVAILLDNRPALLWHFLALGKLGAVASLINTNNAGEPLLHSLRICSPKLVIVGSEHAASFEQIRQRLDPGLRTLVDTDPEHAAQESGATNFGQLLAAAPEADPAETVQQRLGQLAAYIYTSGTTGLPKAARVRHKRIYAMGQLMAIFGWRLRPRDVVYNCLPLYHTSGLAVGMGAVIYGGASMALSRRFSASRFWDEVRHYQATAFVYIGELCRYLMNRPARDDDRTHRISVIVGNGLRPDIWDAFQKRFGIGRVAEFYGSTEGNVGTVNLDGTVGSVGPIFPGNVLVRWDDATGDLVRDPHGFAVKAKTNEPGVLLGRISDPSKFELYQDAQATQKKVVRNVFKHDDAWFNTGDLLRKDSRRRLYFIDRLGDSFRWKGENVSTFEVQEQLSSWPPAREVNVYGVQVPLAEGRAGMVALVVEGPFDAASFKRHVDAVLPAYARPLFVRVQQQLDITGTFKLKKADLVAQGFDPRVVGDPLFIRDPAADAYVALTADVYASLLAGTWRL